jgi:hypothetical protein
MKQTSDFTPVFKRIQKQLLSCSFQLPRHSPFFTTNAQLKAIPYVFLFAVRIIPGQIGSESVASSSTEPHKTFSSYRVYLPSVQDAT